jgi:hypothetical protein
LPRKHVTTLYHAHRVECIGKTESGNVERRHGMTQVTMMSRMVEWFAEQDQTIQAAVLGRYPSEIESDVAKLILKRMAGTPS